MFQTDVVGEIKTHILSSITFLFANPAVYEIMYKILHSRVVHRWPYGTCAFLAWYLRLQTCTHNM